MLSTLFAFWILLAIPLGLLARLLRTDRQRKEKPIHSVVRRVATNVPPFTRPRRIKDSDPRLR